MIDLYPVFIPHMEIMLDMIFHEDENDLYHMQELSGIPVGYYSKPLNKIVTKNEIDKYNLQVTEPNDIAQNDKCIAYLLSKCSLEGVDDATIQKNYNVLGFDMHQIYSVSLFHSRGNIFKGGEIILFSTYLKEIAMKFGCNLYIYLTRIHYVRIVPETAFTKKDGVLNLLIDLCPPPSECIRPPFYNGVFYFDKETENLQLLMRNEQMIYDNEKES